MNTKYFNDAIIGNRQMLASYSKTGELIRLMYPTPDYKQFIDFFHVGIRLNDSGLIYLHNDINNTYKQYYVEETNILKTDIHNSYFNVDIQQTDFVLLKEPVLVRKFEITNKSNLDLNLNFIVYSSLLSNQNNQVSCVEKAESLIQYTHDYNFCIFAKEKMLSSQINNSKESIMEGIIGDKDYIGMSNDSSISYDAGVLHPGEKKSLNLFVYVSENDSKYNIHEIENNIERIRTTDIEREYQSTKSYWKKYLKTHSKHSIKQGKNAYTDRIKAIYDRTILLYYLLTNPNTGGVSAGIEVDEEKTRCGRYSYCWPRDAIFITQAMDAIGMEKETEKFYKNFCKNTQSKNGMWEQRFYTDGRLAPSWGYQVDETASVVFGVYKHYEKTKDQRFLKDNLKMCEKAVEFLFKYVEDIQKEKPEMQLSYDIWEENEGIHTYSLASIFSAFECLSKMYEILKPSFENNRIKLEKMRNEELALREAQVKVKEYINKNLYSTEKNSFVRSSDGKMDISLLGLCIPFKVFAPKEKHITNTVEKMSMLLRTFTGGYLRYEGDCYMGGKNPWVISNLWLACYYLETGENKKAKECFDFVVATSLENGMLAEQIDNTTMRPAWVLGLGWSHAMFIIVLEKLMEKGLI